MFLLSLYQLAGGMALFGKGGKGLLVAMFLGVCSAGFQRGLVGSDLKSIKSEGRSVSDYGCEPFAGILLEELGQTRTTKERW